MNLKNFKQTMIKKAIKKNGIWENFGQKEIRQLKDKYHYNNYANQWKPEEYKIKLAIQELDDWASHFDLSQLDNRKEGELQ